MTAADILEYQGKLISIFSTMNAFTLWLAITKPIELQRWGCAQIVGFLMLQSSQFFFKLSHWKVAQSLKSESSNDSSRYTGKLISIFPRFSKMNAFTFWLAISKPIELQRWGCTQIVGFLM